MTRPRALADALLRLRAAVLDLQTAGCYAEAAELVALVRRCEALIDSAAPRAAAQGEAGARTASPIAPATLGLSEAPVASAPEAGVVPPDVEPPVSEPCCSAGNPHRDGVARLGSHWLAP